MGQMPGWFQRLTQRREAGAGLLGRPAVRRVKHYAALSGYAYEYTFEGYRDHKSTREYHFALSANRREWRKLRIELREESVAGWQSAHERVLAANERYAVAKLALLSALDDAANPGLVPAVLAPGEAEAAELIERLDL
jgi:hypothetical protein